MNKDLKHILIIWILAIIALFFTINNINSAMNYDIMDQNQCPPDSYEIGYDKDTNKLICRNNPTGCPYGDSVPIEDCKYPSAPIENNINNIPVYSQFIPPVGGYTK